MNLLLMPEGIRVEKSLCTGRTGQPCPQMVLAHMSTYGHLGGGQSLSAPLNPAFVNPFDAPTFR